MEFVYKIAFAVIVFSLAAIIYIYPTVGDLWYFTDSQVWRSFRDPISHYISTYTYGNPRIGEALLYTIGGSASWRAVAGALSFAALALSAAQIIVSNTEARLSPYALALIFMSSLMLLTPEVGVTVLYIPFSTNYVFGLALLYLFCWQVMRTRRAATAQNYCVLLLLGIIAGLSNEHTPPAILAFLFIYFVHGLLAKKEFSIPLFAAGSSLFVGFVLLVFAPGQSVRYSGVKYQGLKNFVPQLQKLIDDLPDAIYVIAAACVILGIILVRNGKSQTGYLAISATGAFFLTLATIAASPLIGARLLFAAYSALAFSVTASVAGLIQTDRQLLGCCSTGIIVLVAFLFDAGKWSLTYSHAFNQRAELIRRLQTEGTTDVIVPPYTINFGVARNYLYPETETSDPKNLRNRQMAAYFGVRSLAIAVPEKP